MNTGFPIYGALSSQSWAESAGIEAAADARRYLVPLKVPVTDYPAPNGRLCAT